MKNDYHARIPMRLLEKMHEHGLSPAQRLIVIGLRFYMNPAGTGAFPSIGTLCRVTGLGRSTVKRALRGLEEIGALEVSRTHGRSSQYRLTGFMMDQVDQESTGSSVDPPLVHGEPPTWSIVDPDHNQGSDPMITPSRQSPDQNFEKGVAPGGPIPVANEGVVPLFFQGLNPGIPEVGSKGVGDPTIWSTSCVPQRGPD
jgi:hypothetical protein